MSPKKPFSLASAVLVTLALVGGDASSAAPCQTPQPFSPSQDTSHTAGGVTVRHGPSWTGQPGQHSGVESGTTYVFADASTDGALLEFSAQGISMHAGVPGGGLIDFCLST